MFPVQDTWKDAEGILENLQFKRAILKLVQLWNTVLFATQNVKSEIYRLSIPETVQVAKSPGSVINYISYLSW